MKDIGYCIICLFLFIASCQVDEYDTSTEDPIVLTPETVYVNKLFDKALMSPSASNMAVACITILLPCEVVDDKGNVYTINDQASFDQIVSDVNQKNIIDFKYPMSIQNEFGEEITIKDLIELASFVSNCIPDFNNIDPNAMPAWLINFHNSCYTFKYPIQFTSDQNTKVTVANEKECVLLFDKTQCSFNFPLELLDDFNNSYMADNPAELFNLLASCNIVIGIDSSLWQNDFTQLACYDIQFPVWAYNSMQDSINIQNENDLANLILQARFGGFIFPMTLIDENQLAHVANNDTELDDLINACNGVAVNNDLSLFLSGAADSLPCYTILLPLKYMKGNGEMIEVTDQQTLEQLKFDPEIQNYFMVYPARVRVTKTNEEKIINKIEDLLIIILNC